MKIFVIILNFNGGRDIIECLKSITRESSGLKKHKIRVIVVDNGSTDASLQLIKAQFPVVKVIENKKNLGFAAGNNVGIRYALKQKADAVLLLNQDAVVIRNFWGPLLKNKADIVAPVIKFKRDNIVVYDLGGKINWFLGRSYHLESNCIKRIKNIDYVSGCCMLIGHSVFEKIGLFDESFFLYYEDADFCLRAKGVGFKIAVEPKVVVFHKLKEGPGLRSKKAIFHSLRSNLIFISKHLGWRGPIGYLYLLILTLKVGFNYFKNKTLSR